MKSFFLILLSFLGSIQVALAAEEWERAIEPRDWQFPRDHGAHPDFKTEWWYFTGNLQSDDPNQKGDFGYQLTIFRQGIFRHPQQTQSQQKSQWALHDLFFGHFTMSDLRKGKFLFSEKVDRGALDQAFSREGKMDVKLREWKIQALTPPPHESYRLSASEADRSLDLIVTAEKPLILEGDRGLSHKGPEAGNASYYYSYPRLRTEGSLRIGDRVIPVHGESWFDHEFSTSSLGPDQIGWDWFSLQLSNHEELMLYCMRKKDGSYDLTSAGSWIDTNGQKSDLHQNDFSIQILSHWKSSATGGLYPSKWRILIPSKKLVLIISPRLADQELRLSELGNLSYWEGASAGEGTLDGNAIQALGYVELTGYTGSLERGLKK